MEPIIIVSNSCQDNRFHSRLLTNLGPTVRASSSR